MRDGTATRNGRFEPWCGPMQYSVGPEPRSALMSARDWCGSEVGLGFELRNGVLAG